MKLKIFNQNPVNINSYLLIKQKKSILIDPGFNGKAIIKYLFETNIDLNFILLTHGHFDHIRDIQKLAEKYRFKVYISNIDIDLLKDNTKNYANAFGAKFNFPKDIEIVSIKDKEELTFFNESFKLILTPGHTKGSICIKYNQWFFSGDTIFIDSIGRTDLFSGNSSDMQKSLEYLKKKLSNQTIIYPGHGRYSKWKDVKRVNPYIK